MKKVSGKTKPPRDQTERGVARATQVVDDIVHPPRATGGHAQKPSSGVQSKPAQQHKKKTVSNNASKKPKHTAAALPPMKGLSPLSLMTKGFVG